MTVEEATPKSTLAGQSVSECTIIEVAETDRESHQYLKVGSEKIKLAGVVNGFMDQAKFDQY